MKTKTGGIKNCLTEFDESLAEFELCQKSAVLRVGRPFERRERDKEVMLGREDDHVALLAAVASNQRGFGVQPVVNVDGVQRTTARGDPPPISHRVKNQIKIVVDLLRASVESVKVPEFEPDALAFLPDEFIGTGHVFGIDARIGGRHDVALAFH